LSLGLRSLDLGYCVAISDQGLSFLSHLQKLESLSLSGCLWVHLASLEMPPVAVQSVSNHSDSSLTTTNNKPPNPRFSPAAHPVTQLPSLRYLDFSGSGVRDEGLCQLVLLPKLTDVDLSSCHVSPSPKYVTPVLITRSAGSSNSPVFVVLSPQEISSTSLVTLLLCSGSLTSCHYDDCERVDSREVRTLLRASAALRVPIETSRNHCTQTLFQPLTVGMQAAQA
jgi:Leucine-rich repeat (LRR) protein